MKIEKHTSPLFKLKPFVSFLTIFSFLLLAFSGFILYIRPEGSLARWIGWRAIGLDKSGWEAVHIIFCALFVLAGLTHLVLNFKAIVVYLTKGIDNTRRNLLEMVVAVVVVVVLLVTAVGKMPPSSWLMKGRAAFKNNPRALLVEMPVPDFEKRTLREAAEYLGRSPESVVQELKHRGLKGVSPDITLEKLARQNQMSPQDIYLLIR
ncbi:MAG: DUF4405 domain-containing protein [Candidatus Aminicenantes bacterium]|nr:DUF4405 domain-containing protein [Candidatus Aminicenantes bacterium]